MDNDSPNRAITVPIYVESRYKVNRRSIKKVVEETIEKNGIVGSVEVSIAVVGYPVVITEAVRENMLIDDKINELVEHGVLHLLGFHHR